MSDARRWALMLPVLGLVFMLACTDSSTNSNNGDGAWQTVFSDDFNRADGDPGANWSSQLYPAGSALIANHKLRVADGQFWAVRYAGTVNQADIRVSARCSTATISSATSFAVVARSRNLGNNWMQQEFYMAGAAPASDGISLARYVGSGYQSTTPGTFAMGPNHWYRLSLECDGPALTLIIVDEASGASDSLRVTDTYPALTGTTVSLNGMLGAGEELYFDDFTVQSFE